MPTLGWIQETATERFWEGMTPLLFPPHTYYPCPYCEKHLRSTSEVEEHVNSSHVLDLPVLLVRGNGLPAEITIRSPVDAEEVRLLNCTGCEVRRNGKLHRMSSRAFSEQFAKEDCAVWKIHLTNTHGSSGGRADRQYEVDFRIPNRSELDTIDEAFIKHLAVDYPGHAGIVRFEAETRPKPPAGDYARALVNYVIGLMIKEYQSDLVAPIAFEDYKRKFLEALDVLREFSRPVAQTVVSCIHFNLNSFAGTQQPQPLYALRIGHRFFQSLAEIARVEILGSLDPPKYLACVCPVDTVTEKILSTCEVLMGGSLPSLSAASDFSQLPAVR